MLCVQILLPSSDPGAGAGEETGLPVRAQRPAGLGEPDLQTSGAQVDVSNAPDVCHRLCDVYKSRDVTQRLNRFCSFSRHFVVSFVVS